LRIGTALLRKGTAALTPLNIQKTNAVGRTTAKAATRVIPAIHAANATHGTLGIHAGHKTLPAKEKLPKPSTRDSIHRTAHTSGGRSANLAEDATTATTVAAVAIPTNAQREAVANTAANIAVSTAANCLRPLPKSFFRAKG